MKTAHALNTTDHQLELDYFLQKEQYPAHGGLYVKPIMSFLMAEAQPSKKRGGHAYGRRNLQISNTAEEGELCIYYGHSIGRFSSHSMRYDSHAACVRCVAAAREGRLSFDVDRLLKKEAVVH